LGGDNPDPAMEISPQLRWRSLAMGEPLNILRMMAVHDEADVLPYNLAWYREAGFPTVALVDEDSSDDSLAICERARAEGTIVALETIATESHEIDRIFARLADLAARRQPDALLVTAPDEFFEVADGSDLRTAMGEDFAAGYNLIKFWNMEFHMTREDDPSDPNPLTRMRHYSLWDLEMYRAYPYYEGTDLVPGRGHRPTFRDGVDDRPSPRRYVSRHYPLRSVEQAMRKIQRMRPAPGTPRATTHYLRFSGDPDELYVSPRHLHRYADDNRWSFDQPFLPVRLRETVRALARSEREREELQRRVAELVRRNAELLRDSAPSEAAQDS
jgi:hypothetical protein